MCALALPLMGNSIVDSYYADFYDLVHRKDTAKKANDKLQADLERTRSSRSYANVLELGAGDLFHLASVRHTFERYIAVDIRQPTSLEGWNELFEPKLPEEHGTFFFQGDATSIAFADETFDRLVATCLLMHLGDPLSGLLEWRRLVKVGGVLDILVPCDPGIAVRLYRTFVSRRKAEKLGFEYFDLVNALDHLHPVGSLITIAKYAFKDDDLHVDWYPFHISSWNLNSHAVLRITRR